MCILDCLLVLAIIFYMYKAKIWMGVVTSLHMQPVGVGFWAVGLLWWSFKNFKFCELLNFGKYSTCYQQNVADYLSHFLRLPQHNNLSIACVLIVTLISRIQRRTKRRRRRQWWVAKRQRPRLSQILEYHSHRRPYFRLRWWEKSLLRQ